VPERLRMVAIDLGASSGRVALGTLHGGRVRVEVLHRFPNVPVKVHGRLYWDVLYLWQETLRGMKLAAARGPIASIGVDSWAVDYALLDQGGHLLDGVRCYRDRRTNGVMEEAFRTLSAEAIYRRTGIQFLPFNTLYQLVATKRDAPRLLAGASALLMLPDLLHFWLSGRQVCEATNASTTQFMNPVTRAWATEVLDAFGIPARILPRIVAPGTVLGDVTDEVVEATGMVGTLVVAPGTHDTASAVAAAPADGGTWAYLSSGTWSLLGAELTKPLVTEDARRANFTNEAGVFGTTRLLKNVMGLWILQECVKSWNVDLLELLASIDPRPRQSQFINPDDARFLPPGADMPDRVRAFCRDTDQPIPEQPGEITRCILESLALQYAVVLQELEGLLGTTVDTLHIVGGGSQNLLLSQWTADTCGCRVLCGPDEATLFGNLLMQAHALGRIRQDELRSLVRGSVATTSFTPSGHDWSRAARTYEDVLASFR
jgi:rhamnulokinase